MLWWILMVLSTMPVETVPSAAVSTSVVPVMDASMAKVPAS